MTPDQCRAARGLLDISQAELAERAGVSRSMVRFFEAGRSPFETNREAIRTALVSGGVELLDGERPGVRFAWATAH